MPESEGFDLDAAEAEVVREDYRFRWGGQWWTLKNAFKLPVDLISDAMAGDGDIIRSALREGMGADRYAAMCAVRKLNLDALKLLFGEWTNHSGMDAGESSGSGGSSTSTAEPSKPTSTATTGSDSTAPSTAPTVNASAPAS